MDAWKVYPLGLRRFSEILRPVTAILGQQSRSKIPNKITRNSWESPAQPPQDTRP